MQQEKIMVTGGKGLLCTQMKEFLPRATYVDIEDFNVTDFDQIDAFLQSKSFEMVIHAAAFISPPLIDKDPAKAIDVNIIGTCNMVKACAKHNLKLLYICTDYVFKGDKGNYVEEDPVFPVNKYAWSKLGGECAVRLYENHIIVRTTFGPNVFPFPKAFSDQWTSRESVRTISERIAFLAQQDVRGTFHVGGKRKTVLEYAKSLDPNKPVEKLSIHDVNFKVPVDTSMNCQKFNLLWNSRKE